jgi:hypothetical protein
MLDIDLGALEPFMRTDEPPNGDNISMVSKGFLKVNVEYRLTSILRPRRSASTRLAP